MHWLLLLLALGAMVVAFNTTSALLMGLCLLAALGLTVFAVLQMLAARVDDASRSASQILDPEELRRLREAAEARKIAAAGHTAGPAQGDIAH